MRFTVRWRASCLLALGVLTTSTAWAEWKIGQTAAFTGPVSAGVKEITAGAKLYFDYVNKNGGVSGQNIELISMDDKFDPSLSAANAKKLIDEGVIALFMSRGTPHTQAILPLINSAKVPLIAPSTGAMVLHQPVQPWVFNVRASYQREAEMAIRHMSLIGMTRIALMTVDDSFGQDGSTGALAGFKAVGRSPVVHETFSRTKPDVTPLVKKVIAADSQAVLVVGTAQVVTEVLKQLRAAGSRTQVATLSNNASEGFIKQLGPQARGTIVSQVFPYERSMSNPMVKEANRLQEGKGELTPSMLEGFAAAKVLVEGLRRAGTGANREKLKAALETFRKVDIGGLEVSYTTGDHSGLDYADLSIIDETGHFRR